ncbi:MAG TPA: hypothetical protein GXZ27_02570 [Thermoanaerobacterales bacterium]|jgi:nucleoside-triphosphatase THEP1|nr:hypothetical protein [Thermoanaerobacterales bacterium]
MRHKNFLLQGDIGIGKSTIIRDSIIPYIDFVGGYYTQRVLDGEEKVGFLISPIKSKQDYVLNRDIKDLRLKDKSRLFIFKKPNGAWSFNNEVFVHYSIKYLSKGLQDNKKLLVADELGGMEFQNDSFLQEIGKILLSQVPVLGVLKSSCNFRKLKRATLLETSCKNLEQFKSFLSQRAQVILLAPGMDGNEVVAQVQAFIKKSIMVGN